MTTLACPTCPATVTALAVTAAGHTCPGRAHLARDRRISTFVPAPTTDHTDHTNA